ncbi:hypothetical protein VTI28DRAFT_2307 [Corynascus sepedonium]
MRQVFSRWPIAATAVPAIGPAPENNPPGSSVAATSSTTEIFPSGIKSLYNPEHATVDIVFIHGLTGHREKTWTARGASEPWPKVLLPSELPSARVLTFGYDANVVDWSGVVSQSRIGDHAWNLLTSLAAHREKDETRTQDLRLKTQIALAYVFWLHQKHPDISVFWIHASNAERFRQGYASIAQECQIPGYDDPKTDVLPLVKKWLERKDGSQWLMVIDNADDMQVFFGKQTEPVDDSLSGRMGTVGRYIPDCPHGAILVTTRNLQAGSRLIKGKQPIKVEELNDEETVQLLRTRLDGIDATPSDFSALSSRLEHLPLALVQGAAFIQENGLTIDEYFRLLDNSDQHLVDLLSEEFETEGRDSETPRAVAETWILSFEQIQRQNALAAKLLSLMSLLDRQAIPMEFLSQYSEQKGEEQWSGMELTKAVGVLKAFCFIVGDEGRGFDIHRLVQLVTQKWLRRKDMMQSFATQALLVVSQAYPYGNYENWAICNAYLPHATAVLSLGDSGTNKQSMARASLLYCVAGFFYYKGRWKDAGTLFKQATDIQKGVLGEEHPETLSSIADLAAAYWNQGRWKEAENLEVQVIETRKRVLGEEHPDTLSSISALALTYQRQGRWREAENLAAPVMETRKKVLGEEHPDTLTSMDGVAWTYRSQGRLKEAEDLEMQVMETRKRVLGEEHPDTLISMGNLAEAYQDRGRWKEAVDLAVQVMETRKRVLGEEHPDTLTSMANCDKPGQTIL